MINRRVEAQEHKEWLNTVKEYKESFYLLKSVKWYKYVLEVKDCKKRWKITKYFVKQNSALLLYLMVKSYAILCKIKRRKR